MGGLTGVKDIEHVHAQHDTSTIKDVWRSKDQWEVQQDIQWQTDSWLITELQALPLTAYKVEHC